MSKTLEAENSQSYAIFDNFEEALEESEAWNWKKSINKTTGTKANSLKWGVQWKSSPAGKPQNQSWSRFHPKKEPHQAFPL